MTVNEKMKDLLELGDNEIEKSEFLEAEVKKELHDVNDPRLIMAVINLDSENHFRFPFIRRAAYERLLALGIHTYEVVGGYSAVLEMFFSDNDDDTDIANQMFEEAKRLKQQEEIKR